jgi:hypothetical protein
MVRLQAVLFNARSAFASAALGVITTDPSRFPSLREQKNARAAKIVAALTMLQRAASEEEDGIADATLQAAMAQLEEAGHAWAAAPVVYDEDVLDAFQNEPSSEDDATTLVRLHETLAETVENARRALFRFWDDSKDSFPEGQIKASIELSLQVVNGEENLPADNGNGHWSLHEMAVALAAKEARLGRALADVRAKLEMLESVYDCPICLEPIDDFEAEGISLGCCHKLHRECWIQWRAHCDTQHIACFCPLCREDEFLDGILSGHSADAPTGSFETLLTPPLLTPRGHYIPAPLTVPRGHYIPAPFTPPANTYLDSPTNTYLGAAAPAHPRPFGGFDAPAPTPATGGFAFGAAPAPLTASARAFGGFDPDHNRRWREEYQAGYRIGYEDARRDGYQAGLQAVHQALLQAGLRPEASMFRGHGGGWFGTAHPFGGFGAPAPAPAAGGFAFGAAPAPAAGGFAFYAAPAPAPAPAARHVRFAPVVPESTFDAITPSVFGAAPAPLTPARHVRFAPVVPESTFDAITPSAPHNNISFEELRHSDYAAGRRGGGRGYGGFNFARSGGGW